MLQWVVSSLSFRWEVVVVVEVAVVVAVDAGGGGWWVVLSWQGGGLGWWIGGMRHCHRPLADGGGGVF